MHQNQHQQERLQTVMVYIKMEQMTTIYLLVMFKMQEVLHSLHQT